MLNVLRLFSYHLPMSSTTPSLQPNNPLHGITLKMMLTELVDYYSWQQLAKSIPIKCFSNDPSIQSSLKFLRKTPWAREKVEALYLSMVNKA